MPFTFGGVTPLEHGVDTHAIQFSTPTMENTNHGVCAALVAFWLSARAEGRVIKSIGEFQTRCMPGPAYRVVPWGEMTEEDGRLRLLSTRSTLRLDVFSEKYARVGRRARIARPGGFEIAQASAEMLTDRELALKEYKRYRSDKKLPARWDGERDDVREYEEGLLGSKRAGIRSVFKTEAKRQTKDRAQLLDFGSRSLSSQQRASAIELARVLSEEAQQRAQHLHDRVDWVVAARRRAAKLAEEDDAEWTALESDRAWSPFGERLMNVYGITIIDGSVFKSRWHQPKKRLMEKVMSKICSQPGVYFLAILGSAGHGLGIVTEEPIQVFDPNYGVFTFEHCGELRKWLPGFILHEYRGFLKETYFHRVGRM